VFPTVRKGKPSATTSRMCCAEQMADCSTLWARRMHNLSPTEICTWEVDRNE